MHQIPLTSLRAIVSLEAIIALACAILACSVATKDSITLVNLAGQASVALLADAGPCGRLTVPMARADRAKAVKHAIVCKGAGQLRQRVHGVGSPRVPPTMAALVADNFV